MSDPLRVLLVEDSPTDAKLVLVALRAMGRELETQRVDEASTLREALEASRWDVVISDWSMPRFSALEALAIVKQQAPELPFVIVSGTIGEEAAVEAMRAGAHDYVLKDRLARLAPAVERELREAESRAAHKRAAGALEEMERQLRQAQKMEAIGLLAAGVAHDFNNALSVILSYAEIVGSELDPAGQHHADIQEIQKAGKRAAEMTRQLLAFSRQQSVELKVVDLNVVFDDLEKMLRRLVGEDVAIEMVRCRSQARVRADVGSLEQALVNLIVNARDAMPEGGSIAIETAVEELDGTRGGLKAGAYVVLTVRDDGVGMDAATRARIFEPFFTTKPTGRGTGLGLSTVFGIVAQHGGCVEVRSEPGEGSAFSLYFPRADAPRDARRISLPPATSRGTETILLVEDEAQVRTVATEILRRHGYDVISVSSADEALARCESSSTRIDLLLTDVVMPQMSGLALARRLAARREGMKVLWMSGYSDDIAVRSGLADVGAAYLPKPFTVQSLTWKVREVLDPTP